MKAYPAVIPEDATLDAVLAGASIARYGDGELRLALRHTDRPGQPYDKRLAARLREILWDGGPCLVGIPNHAALPPHKRLGWAQYRDHWVLGALNPARTYHSSFITRPDCAPVINRPDYWAKVRSLWAGKDVTLVRGNGAKSLMAHRMPEACSVREVIGPRIGAWSEYDRLMREVGTPDHPVLICLGLTATVMAADLCAKGVWAVDAGHIGLFAKRLGPDGIWHPKKKAA